MYNIQSITFGNFVYLCKFEIKQGFTENININN